MTLGERIRRNEREEKMRIANKARKEGIKEGMQALKQEKVKLINETIIKMLNLKLDEKIIKEVTGVKDIELENVKRQLLEV